MKRVAILPARGGSVRVPRKNIRAFHGRPMISYPIDAARRSELFDAIVVSTDDEEIADVAQGLGAQVHWRQHCDGTMGTQEIAAKVLREVEWFDAACVIYPCSPLLLPSDLTLGWSMLTEQHARYVMTVQTDPLADAGCFYWGWRGAFIAGLPLIDIRTAMLPLPRDRCIDINTLDDMERAAKMYSALLQPTTEGATA